MRTAQALGIKCVAVFSEADRNSMHVKMVRCPFQIDDLVEIRAKVIANEADFFVLLFGCG